MLVLGISGGFHQGCQDSSAVLMRDGKLILACEEERLNRIKYAPGQMPEKAIQWILEEAKISIQDIDLVGVHGSTFGEEFKKRLKSYFNFRFQHAPPLLRFHHHLAHAASAYYASGFPSAMILTMDNSGDGVSTQAGVGSEGKIKVLEQYKRPQSLGLFYSMMTQFCGFQKDSDEYKLMGLSSYGQPNYDLNPILSIEKGSYELNEDFIASMKPGRPQPHKQEPLFSDKLISHLKLKPRRPTDPITQAYKDLAASVQYQLEKAVIELVTDLYKKTKIDHLCLAGGVALNCLANQKLADLDFIKNIYIQPASSDAGISLGAAYLGCLELEDKTLPMDSPFLGPSYSNAEIFKELKSCEAPFKEIDNPEETGAKKLSQNKIIGWHQGAAEFGPRALGNRSILANPFDKSAKDKVNSKIKFRESFRPFGVSLLAEDKSDLLDSPLKGLPYMTITSKVKKPFSYKMPSITHIDGTTRPQTCSEEQNQRYWNLLKSFGKKSGHGAVLNTSFNKNLEPIVNSPKEALAAFFSSGLDCLIMGNFLIEKTVRQ